MRLKLSLQSRLTACFLAFSVLPLLLFFLVFFPYLSGSMLKTRMATLEGLANANVSDLEQMGDSILRDGERLAMDQRVLALLHASGEPDAQLAATTEAYLQSIVNDSCRGAALIKAGWKVAAASDAKIYTGEALSLLLGTDASFSGQREVTGLLPSIAVPGEQSIYFTVPILSGNSLLGTLVREMPLTVLSRKTASLRQGETGRMMLVDQSGMILSHTESSQVGKTLLSDRLLSVFTNFQRGLAERSGNGSTLLFDDKQGYGYRILGNMPWMLVVYQAESELRSQEVLIVLFAVLATLGLALLSFLISRIVSKSLVFPLRRLNAAFRQVGFNQFISLTPGGTSEMVELAEGYNAMIGLLEKNITQLSDSNRQLATTIAELEVERDRLQFIKDAPNDHTICRASAEFNLVSGEFLADDAFFSMLHLDRSMTKLSLAEFLNTMADKDDADALLSVIDHQEDQVHKLIHIHVGEELLFIQVHARIYYNTQGDPTKVSATLMDVTDDYKAPGEEAVADSATGLSTKAPFMQALAEHVSQHENELEGGMVVCLSLMGLPTEDTQRMGYVLALRLTADRLRAFAAPDGMAARLHDDRFLLHLPRCTSFAAAESRMADLNQVLLAPIPWQKSIIQLKMLAGASLYPQKGVSAEMLFAQAQTALSAASALKGTSWTLYDADREADADTARVTMESARRSQSIVDALSTFQIDNALSLEYQPIIHLTTNAVAGFECTVRLKVKELGMVSAGELIPQAEANGLMLPVGRFVLKEAVKQIKHLRKRQDQDLYVSVNVSAVQLAQEDFADTVYLALKEAGLPGNALQLEISERMMDVFINQADKLHALRRLGVKVALDDYGAGTGALTHLYNMPLDVLKVDKSFLTGATASQGKEFILKTLVDLAHNLNLTVAAVGVEHFKRLNTLIKLNYDLAQGYHFCPPLNPTALEVYLDTRSAEGGK